MGSIPSCVITAFGKEFGEADGNYRQGLSSASTDNPYQDLDYSGYHKKPYPIAVLLYIARKKNGHDSKWN